MICYRYIRDFKYSFSLFPLYDIGNKIFIYPPYYEFKYDGLTPFFLKEPRKTNHDIGKFNVPDNSKVVDNLVYANSGFLLAVKKDEDFTLVENITSITLSLNDFLFSNLKMQRKSHFLIILTLEPIARILTTQNSNLLKPYENYSCVIPVVVKIKELEEDTEIDFTVVNKLDSILPDSFFESMIQKLLEDGYCKEKIGKFLLRRYKYSLTIPGSIVIFISNKYPEIFNLCPELLLKIPKFLATHIIKKEGEIKNIPLKVYKDAGLL